MQQVYQLNDAFKAVIYLSSGEHILHSNYLEDLIPSDVRRYVVTITYIWADHP